MGSGNRPNQKTRRQKEVFYQPSLRETSQKLWRWPRHPAKTRLDPIRSMAKIHQTPMTTICPPSSIEGSSINQPVQPNLGKTNPRKKNDSLPELKPELPDNQIPQASDQPLWPAVSTKSSTSSTENKPNLSLSP